MAAAQQLRRAGHAVTLFERDEAAGGLVRFGVPDFKIEKHVVERRVQQLVDEGVEVRCGVDVGVDLSADELRESFDAVVLATGSRTPRDLPAPGRELDGIHFAMDYLYDRNRWVATQTGTPTGCEPPALRGPDREGQARRRHRRRRHRRGLRRQLAARGREVDHPARAAARAAAQAPRRPHAVAAVAAEVPALLRDGGGQGGRSRRAGLLDRHDALRGRRRRPRARAALRAGRAGAAVQAGARHRGRVQGRPRAAGDGLPASRAGPARQARRREGRARQREGDQALHDLGRGRLRRRRRAPRPVAHRVGDQRGPPVRADGRSLPRHARPGAGRDRRGRRRGPERPAAARRSRRPGIGRRGAGYCPAHGTADLHHRHGAHRPRRRRVRAPRASGQGPDEHPDDDRDRPRRLVRRRPDRPGAVR